LATLSFQGQYRTLTGSHKLPVKRNNLRAAPMSRSGRNRFWHLLTSALELTATRLLPAFGHLVNHSYSTVHSRLNGYGNCRKITHSMTVQAINCILILGCIAMRSIRCGLLLPLSRGLSVCLSLCLLVTVSRERELCYNGRTDRDAAWVWTRADPRSRVLVGGGRGSQDFPQERTLLGVLLGYAQICRRSIFSTIFARGSSDAAFVCQSTVASCFVHRTPQGKLDSPAMT